MAEFAQIVTAGSTPSVGNSRTLDAGLLVPDERSCGAMDPAMKAMEICVWEAMSMDS